MNLVIKKYLWKQLYEKTNDFILQQVKLGLLRPQAS